MAELGRTSIAKSGLGPVPPGSTRSVEACSSPFGHSEAWMMTQLGRATRGGVTVKSTLVRPAGTTTSRGVTTCPSMLPLRRTHPPAGAGDVSVTVPVVVLSPTIVDGPA